MNKGTALVIDDEAQMRKLLEITLESHDYRVALAATAREGLAMATMHPPQFILLDLGLPDMDGTELAKTLRQRPECSSSLMVAITGYGQNSDRIKSIDAGFDHHLVKPVDMPRLLKILSETAV